MLTAGFAFDFADNWDNQGSARLTPEGVLTLEERKPAPDFWGRNALRQYGEFTLTKADCEKKNLKSYRRPR
jgi:hypothetical protein